MARFPSLVSATALVVSLVLPISAQVTAPSRPEAPVVRADAPAGQVTFAATVTLAPTWFDPAETPGVITPFLTLYALHDALVKPMPGNAWAPCLAESWTASKDGLTYEFVLRKGLKFHNGDPLTADDVKFSFERYRGAANRFMKDKVAMVEVVDPGRVRFVSSALGPRIEYATSVSPRLSIARRVDSSGTDLNTRRFTAGGFRQ